MIFVFFWLDFWFGRGSAEIEVIASGAMTLSGKHCLLHAVRLSYQLGGLKRQSILWYNVRQAKEKVSLEELVSKHEQGLHTALPSLCFPELV